MPKLPLQIVSPRQASDIYSNSKAFPKQRHLFLVRFNKSSGKSPTTTLTYAVKAMDRPAIQLITEELNQYNKKRQVYTGYKKSPVKCVFYDDAAGSAQVMWSEYSKYYFGDFASGNDRAFGDDITSPEFLDRGSDFGFTAKNGGDPNSGSQWYFRSIEILHFHNQVYDLYTLVNPRLTSFAPDELDYEQFGIAMINAEFVYEALIFTPNFKGNGNVEEEFSEGKFNGHTNGTQADASADGSIAPASQKDLYQQSQDSVEKLFGDTNSSPLAIPNYRYFNNSLLSATSGGLQTFGKFIFGGDKKYGHTSGSLANNALASILGNAANPLSSSKNLGFNNGYRGVSPQFPGVVAGISSVMNASYGNIGQQLAQGVLGASAVNASNNASINNGNLSLTPDAFGIINSQRPGSSQIGVNTPSISGGRTDLYNVTVGYGRITSENTFAPPITSENTFAAPISAVTQETLSAPNITTPQTTAQPLPLPPVPPSIIPQAAGTITATPSALPVDTATLDTLL